jgi:hypothetical protein
MGRKRICPAHSLAMQATQHPARKSSWTLPELRLFHLPHRRMSIFFFFVGGGVPFKFRLNSSRASARLAASTISRFLWIPRLIGFVPGFNAGALEVYPSRRGWRNREEMLAELHQPREIPGKHGDRGGARYASWLGGESPPNNTEDPQ